MPPEKDQAMATVSMHKKIQLCGFWDMQLIQA